MSSRAVFDDPWSEFWTTCGRTILVAYKKKYRVVSPICRRVISQILHYCLNDAWRRDKDNYFFRKSGSELLKLVE
jgi:hypothetical protein